MRRVEGSTADDVVPHVGNTKSAGGRYLSQPRSGPKIKKIRIPQGV